MHVKDSKGYDVYMSIDGDRDDVQISEIYYDDLRVPKDTEVPESEIDWIMSAYAAEIDLEWIENMACAAEDHYDLLMDR